MKIFNFFKAHKYFGIFAFWKTNSPVEVQRFINGRIANSSNISNWLIPLSNGRNICISRSLMGCFSNQGDAIKALRELKDSHKSCDLVFKIVINPCRPEFVNDLETVHFMKQANRLWAHLYDGKQKSIFINHKH